MHKNAEDLPRRLKRYINPTNLGRRSMKHSLSIDRL